MSVQEESADAYCLSEDVSTLVHYPSAGKNVPDFLQRDGLDAIAVAADRRRHEEGVVNRFLGRLDGGLKQWIHLFVAQLLGAEPCGVAGAADRGIRGEGDDVIARAV